MAAVGNPLALGRLPILTIEEAGRFQGRPVDAVQTPRVHGDLVGLRARHVEGCDAAMRTKGMLGDSGLEGVEGQRVLAAQ